jgi:hypothetical protein
MRNRKDFSKAKIATMNVTKADLPQTPILRTCIPDNTVLYFPFNTSAIRRYDFAQFYGKGFDAVTIAFQQSIEIMQEQNTLSIESSFSYFRKGMSNQSTYLILYRI